MGGHGPDAEKLSVPHCGLCPNLGTPLGLLSRGVELFLNDAVEPLARKIDRQPRRGTDVETDYVLRLVCRNDDEAKLRVLLMHQIPALPITLHAPHSEDLNSGGKVEVRATLVSSEWQNAMLEDIVQRLGRTRRLSCELGARNPGLGMNGPAYSSGQTRVGPELFILLL